MRRNARGAYRVEKVVASRSSSEQQEQLAAPNARLYQVTPAANSGARRRRTGATVVGSRSSSEQQEQIAAPDARLY